MPSDAGARFRRSVATAGVFGKSACARLVQLVQLNQSTATAQEALRIARSIACNINSLL